MGYVKDISMLINFREALLLLSNQKRGVQFLYGKKYTRGVWTVFTRYTQSVDRGCHGTLIDTNLTL